MDSVAVVPVAADEPPTTPVDVEAQDHREAEDHVAAQVDVRAQAKVAAERIVRECPQLWGLDPKTRGRLRQGIAKSWRRWADRPVEGTIAAVVAELDLAEADGRLHRNHLVLIRQVLARWDSDRLVAPQVETGASDEPAVASGPSLEELAGRTMPLDEGVDDLETVLVGWQISLARQVLQNATGDSVSELDAALRQARAAAGRTVADQHRSMLVLAAAKVRTACHVTAQQRATRHTEDDDEMSPEEVLAAAMASLAEASRRPCGILGQLVAA